MNSDFREEATKLPYRITNPIFQSAQYDNFRLLRRSPPARKTHTQQAWELHTKIKCAGCVVLYDTFDYDTRCSLRHISSREYTTHSSTTHKNTTQYVCCDTFLPANVRHILRRHIKLRHEVLVATHPSHCRHILF